MATLGDLFANGGLGFTAGAAVNPNMQLGQIGYTTNQPVNLGVAQNSGGLASPSVLGTQSPLRIGSGGGGYPEVGNPFGNVAPPQQTQIQQVNPLESINNQMKGTINQGWDAYTGQLNDILNIGLPGQKQAQETIANTSFNQGISDLNAQKTQSEQALEAQKASSLRDLSSNIANLFKSGQTFLGARGAGDSSAANQYSYAISKMGAKERSNVLSQVNQRLNQIGDIYNQETNRLKNDLTTKIASIAQWFNEAQNQIKSQIGQAGLGRSQDINSLSQNILNQAMQAVQLAQQEAVQRRSSLETWAMNNSKTTQELIANLRNISSSMPQFTGLQGGFPQVSSQGQYLPAGYGGGTDERLKGLFG